MQNFDILRHAMLIQGKKYGLLGAALMAAFDLYEKKTFKSTPNAKKISQESQDLPYPLQVPPLYGLLSPFFMPFVALAASLSGLLIQVKSKINLILKIVLPARLDTLQRSNLSL